MAQDVIGPFIESLRRYAERLHLEAHRQPGDRPDAAAARQVHSVLAADLEDLADSLEADLCDDEQREP